MRRRTGHGSWAQKWAWWGLVFLLWLGAPGATARATTSGDSSAPRISVLTFGPGDETFSKFGHDAIWVSDPREPPGRRDWVFNYGTFRFDSPWLILDFLKGKLSYWLSVGSLERTLAGYKAANRSVSAQELALDPDTARALTAFLIQNARPENAYYRYDYYRDNCATRIRDVLDRHLDGALGAASQAPASLTYREHTQRLTVGAPFLYFGLDLAMGPLIDRPVTQWEEMFLPAQVESVVARATGRGGAPLVKSRRVLFQADRPDPPQQAPGFPWVWLIAGTVSGGAIFGLGRLRQRWAGAALAGVIALVGTLGGILGSLLLVLWLLTDHDVTYWNQNVLLCPIWLLALPVFARDFGRATPRRAPWLTRFACATAASSLLALLLRISPWAAQDTTTALALFLPLWLGVAGAAWQRAPLWVAAGRAPLAEQRHA